MYLRWWYKKIFQNLKKLWHLVQSAALLYPYWWCDKGSPLRGFKAGALCRRHAIIQKDWLPRGLHNVTWEVNTINNWVRDSSLAFSVSNCKYMLISCERQGYCDLLDLLVDDLTHERAECFKYLRVILSPQTWCGRIMWNLSAPSHENCRDFFTASYTSMSNHQHYCSFIIPR